MLIRTINLATGEETQRAPTPDELVAASAFSADTSLDPPPLIDPTVGQVRAALRYLGKTDQEIDNMLELARAF
jgi:hypothetical protein